MNIFSKSVNNYTDKVDFNVKTIEKGHHKVLYKNIPTLKCPFDYVIYQMIFNEVKPDLIIEIGTNNGGSALYYADLLETIGKGEIHTIDIVDIRHEEVKKHDRIKFFGDGFQEYDLENVKNFDTILVIDDGSHTFEHVRDGLSKFQDIVSKNSYFIVEDGILDKLGWKKLYNGGPNDAIKEFIKKNENYIIDRKWCDFFGTNATFNTNGFLRRIK
jgi:cephalosporin hydroxylase